MIKKNGHSMPEVSVIIPTYNRAHLIGRAISSVLQQTYNDFELIVVDDGSVDNTAEIVNSFNDRRIRLVRHHRNRGVSAARNTGIKMSRGEYVAFQDSDDEWLPRKLEKQLDLFKNDRSGDLGLVVCEYMIISEKGEKRCSPRINSLNYEQLLRHFGGYGEATQRFMLKRDLTSSELYFDESLHAWEEWDLLFRISRICRIDYVREMLVKYYRHDEPHVDVPSNRIQAREALLKKYAEELATNPRGLSYGHWQIALDYHKTGEMSLVRYHLGKSIHAYPWNPDYYLQYAAAVFGRTVFKITFGLRHAVAYCFKSLGWNSKRVQTSTAHTKC
jgi:glycosyltransferase involved in cell wall biosynthesis